MTSFPSLFTTIPDPRQSSKVIHPLPELLLLCLLGILCGCETWEEIEDYGHDKLDLLREYAPYANGVPSDNTLCRLFSALDADALRECFLSFVASLFPQAGERLIAIDGKASRGSRSEEKGALHTVSAYATEARLVLAQVAANEKSNEITAIPKLLDLLDVEGATVTIDAAGCQHAIAEKIVGKGADYALALKGNQGTLHGCAKALFANAPAFADSYEESGEGHGRAETRRCDVLTPEDTRFLAQTKAFPHLKSVIRVTAERRVKGKITEETRYFLSSARPDAKAALHAVRGHWGIENGLHWTLDVSFREDASRIRKDNAPLCMAVMRHIAFNLIQQAKKKGQSVNRLRKKAGRSDATLREILNAGNS